MLLCKRYGNYISPQVGMHQETYLDYYFYCYFWYFLSQYIHTCKYNYWCYDIGWVNYTIYNVEIYLVWYIQNVYSLLMPQVSDKKIMCLTMQALVTIICFLIFQTFFATIVPSSWCDILICLEIIYMCIHFSNIFQIPTNTKISLKKFFLYLILALTSSMLSNMLWCEDRAS